jgi:putative Holliday junction resolvase
MRIIGLDLGERRIGVAGAEVETRVAIPITTVEVAGDPVESIARVAQEQRADELVVGLPLSMSGAMGAQAQRVMSIVGALEARLSIPVHTWDERLTTVQAGRSAPGSRRGRSAPAAGRDAVAAAILLQAYLDGRFGS